MTPEVNEQNTNERKLRKQKFHTDDVFYPDLDSASDWLK